MTHCSGFEADISEGESAVPYPLLHREQAVRGREVRRHPGWPTNGHRGGVVAVRGRGGQSNGHRQLDSGVALNRTDPIGAGAGSDRLDAAASDAVREQRRTAAVGRRHPMVRDVGERASERWSGRGTPVACPAAALH